MGRDFLGLVPDLAGGHRCRRACDGRTPTSVSPEPVGGGIGVPLLDLDVIGRDAQFFGDDLREGRLVALSLRLRPKACDHLTRGMYTQLA